MTTASEYRLMADECFQWARDAKTNSVRLTYLGIAKIWLEAAVRQDGGVANTPTITLTPTPLSFPNRPAGKCCLRAGRASGLDRSTSPPAPDGRGHTSGFAPTERKEKSNR